MKRLLLFLLFPLVIHSQAPAKVAIYPTSDKTFGLGAILGSPTGLSAQFRELGGRDAVDVSLVVPRGLTGDYSLVTDFLTRIDVWKLKNVEHPIQWGVGGYFRSETYGVTLALRLPVNLLLYFGERRSLQGFLQIVPTIPLLPAVSRDVTFALGMRYFFN